MENARAVFRGGGGSVSMHGRATAQRVEVKGGGAGRTGSLRHRG
ncbi:MAG TPA: hypothetical protein VND19_18720 [Acetobacteraceae bacterium]|nr:hypothetical protein [Acetobacteraceae bacterium]